MCRKAGPRQEGVEVAGLPGACFCFNLTEPPVAGQLRGVSVVLLELPSHEGRHNSHPKF